jgi:apolipoprotein N-acyltransferase
VSTTAPPVSATEPTPEPEDAPEPTERSGRLRIILASLGTGLLLAAALPPWGWWPLAFVGLAGFDRLIANQPRGARFLRGWGVGLGLYIPSQYWMKDLTLPGYLVATVAYAALVGVAALVVPKEAPARWLALPGAVAATELLRWSWPFGGVPLSSLAVGQVAGPLAPILRVGGALLLVELTVIVGVTLAAAVARQWKAVGVGAAVVVAALGFAAVAPRAHQVGTMKVALVQGGGKQGTRAEDTDERKVFERHMAASEKIKTPVDLVIWPEDVVNVDGPFKEAPERNELSELARRLDAPLVVGVVEDADPGHFLNASVLYDRDGRIIDRYDKVHRVPFGEYVPMRSFLETFAKGTLPSKDAIAGKGPGELHTPAGKVAVAISWEIFFGDRVREGVERGGQVVLNPTNGSSYTGTLVQTQQVATSRMRAIESDRWVLQVAPTGFTAIIGPTGHVHQRSGVSEQIVLQGQVGRRAGTTLYTRWGLLPAWLVGIASLGGGWALAVLHRKQTKRQQGVAVSSPSAS